MSISIWLNINDSPTLTDISASVLSMSWEIGTQDPFARSADVGVATLLIDPNLDISANPEWIGRWLQIKLNTVIVFCGTVQAMDVVSDDWGNPRIKVTAHDVLGEWQNVVARITPKNTQHANDIIEELLMQIPYRREYLTGRWLLKTGYSQLGTDTILSRAGYPTTLETSVSQFIYAGDDWHEVSVTDALRRVAQGEQGDFFIQRDGTAIFHNRHHVFVHNDPIATFTDAFDTAHVAIESQHLSDVTVMYQPRTLSDPNIIIWTLNNPISVPAMSTQTFTVAVRDENDQPCSVIALNQPVLGTNYQFNQDKDGFGLDVTPVIKLTARSLQTEIEIQIINDTPTTVYMQSGAFLEGQILCREGDFRVQYGDNGTRVFHGNRQRLFRASLIDTTEQANDLARHFITQYRTPTRTIQSITLNTTQYESDIETINLGDRIRMHLTTLNHTQDAIVIGIEHTHDSQTQTVTYHLRPTPSTAFWQINQGALNTVRIVY